jgi:hypothetical protein
MRCENIKELLFSYLDNELSPDERKAVDRHLVQCRDCAALLALYREMQESLTQFPEVEPSQELLERIYEIPNRPRLFSFSIFLRPALQPVLAAATAMMLLGSFYFFHPDRQRINDDLNRSLHMGYSKIERIYAQAEAFTASLGKYKNDFLVSLDRLNPFNKDGEQK